MTFVATAFAGNLTETPHPRLWFPKSAEAGLHQRLAKDPLAAELHKTLLRQAEKMLTARTCIYQIPDGRRLLMESRLALSQILHTAWAWRCTGDERFRQRCIKELEAELDCVEDQLIEAQKAPTPAPTARAVAESHAEAWLPRMDTMRFTRQPVLICDDRDFAFAWQREQGVQPSLGHHFAVSPYFRTPKGYPACAVY